MKTKFKILIPLIVMFLIVFVTLSSLSYIEIYSLLFLFFALTDPESCGKFMAENTYMRYNMEYGKDILTDDMWDDLQPRFDKKQADLKSKAIEFGCVDVIENRGWISLFPDMQEKVLEIWKYNWIACGSQHCK